MTPADAPETPIAPPVAAESGGGSIFAAAARGVQSSLHEFDLNGIASQFTVQINQVLQPGFEAIQGLIDAAPDHATIQAEHGEHGDLDVIAVPHDAEVAVVDHPTDHGSEA